jgi:hypothetical protein
MTQPADPTLLVIVPVVSGLFALLGGFVGAWLARRTEYEKWLRQERSAAFAEFLRQLHKVREKAIDVVYAHDHSEQQRDLKVTELFVGLDGQENIVRLYLKSCDRDRFSELKKELWVLHGPSIKQVHRIKRVEEVLSEVQEIFERTLHS